ncbi:MAG: glycerol-3-phosphate dehydrogenase/oxidase [Chloroflexota bacterium]|nr:glycerol-3-phosphate dehydrogenase/oxidase [Chloroflexota bacterium]
MASQINGEFSAKTRHANLQSLKQGMYDILIVGGGITGAGIARDAAMRGYRVALVDKGDFASGTSSKSSKLVHGGVRYLEMFQFGLVFEASRERRTLWQIAPHLVQPLPFLFPVYRDSRWHPWMIDMGLWMYDGLALFRNFKRHEMFSNREIARRMKGIDVGNISGGAHYYDGQVDDARLTLETIRTAHKHSASVANYVQVDALLKKDGKVVGVQAHDALRGTPMHIHARVVVNATGPWTDTLLQLDDPRAPKRLHPTKGIHILVPREKIGGDSAVAFPSHSDGRLMFVIPWGKFSIIGTTDTDYQGDLDQVFADAADVDYVMAAAQHAFPGAPLQKSDVISTYAGLRPLVMQQGKSATKTSREHEIWTTASGLVTIAGGKLTTYRAMAEELVNLVAKRLGTEFDIVAQQPCMTARMPLVEASGTASPDGLPPDVIEHLTHAHGPERASVLELAKRDSRLTQPIVDGLPYIWAEVPYALEQEMAMTVTDVLERRMHILNESRDQGLNAAPKVAAYLGAFLDWDETKTDREQREYQEQVDLANQFRR